jgi:Domain of unknown function (DUF4845)
MRNKQRGVTFIGWLLLLVPIAIVLYAGIRLAPMYLNYMRVSKSLSRTATETASAGGAGLNPQVMRTTLAKLFDIESIEHPDIKDIDIHREGDHWVAIADYEDVAPMFGNVSLLVQFHKQVDMQ